MNSYDVIIIGAGPGGYETAVEAARAGKRVALVEKGSLGGTCLNRGCIPTKSFAGSARTVSDIMQASEFGITAGTPVVDLQAVVARKDRIVSELREGIATLLDGVELIHGEARIDGHEVIVADLRISAPVIIIATGSVPARLDIPGAHLAMTSDDILNLGTVPPRLTIIGAGVIGVEFASIFAAFGSKVTLLEYCPEILPPFDAEIAKRLRMALKRRGISIETGVTVKAISDDLTVKALSRRQEKEYASDAVLMAVGRKPLIPQGTRESGIDCGSKGIIVDDRMQTSAEGIYAIGDVNGRMMLAHAATAQGRVALGLDQQLWPVPSAVFSMPEAAMTGLTEGECRSRGIDMAIGRATFRANGKALASGETEGMVKVIVDRSTNLIAGAHIVGPHASDLIHELSLAIAADIDAAQAANAIHAHPTLAETVAQALKNAINS